MENNKMKKLLILLLAAIAMLTGCNGDAPPENPVFGQGKEYTLGELSFKTENEVDDFSMYEIQVIDGEYIIKITCWPLQENEPDIYEDVKHIISMHNDLWNTLSQANPDAERNTDMQRKTAEIDGYKADAIMFYSQIIMPEGWEYYNFQQFLESAKITTEKYSYTITYIGYTEEDTVLDMEYLKERARNIYYGIEITPETK